jgi:hypothetical protein
VVGCSEKVERIPDSTNEKISWLDCKKILHSRTGHTVVTGMSDAAYSVK